ncbi:ABC transporter permease [Nocardioides humilatus]|uniref:ABC transporter permease n=1 Tax=Nocardioides humilatus TaxID=2607660 RepID=A0A5B1LGV5_9ACTN|nr:ABC transporter permease [Nocardioides humilatus]KAA1418857.1 ABC transporter permease [Nocardioides humilatus]
MTTATPAPMLNVAATAPIPFWRLVLVEFRKSYNTRAGFWLLFTIGLLITLLQVVQLFAFLAQDYFTTFTDFTGNVWLVSLVLVPMLPILLVTTEWTQRTAVVTFAIEPRRVRVILAKLAVAVLLAIAVVVLMLVVAAACTLVADVLKPDLTEWSVDTTFVFAGAPLTILTTTVFGFAVACLLLNTPAAIVLFLITWYASIGIFAAIAALIPPFEDLLPWITLQINVLTLADGLPSAADDWAHLVVSLALWIGLPLALGMGRILRAEVK